MSAWTLEDQLTKDADEWRSGKRRFDRDGDYAECPRCHTSPAYYRKRVAGINDWTDAAVCASCGYGYPIHYLEESCASAIN